MKVDPLKTVGDIAVDLRESIPLFEGYGIDYCCGGGRSLKDACYLAGAPLEEVLAGLEKIEPTPLEWYQEPDWRHESMGELIDYILKVHHAYTRKQTKCVTELLEKVMSRPEGHPAEIPTLRSLFLGMAVEMEEHMRREEETVFPYLREVEVALLKKQPIPKPFQKYEFLNHPLYVLASDHGTASREWKEIELLTGHFKAPASQKEVLQPLYDALQALDRDQREHMHLENNVLLKRASDLGLLN